MSSLWIFNIIVGALAIQRIFELRLSQHNLQKLLQQGAEEKYPEHYRVMVILHTSWFGCMLLEVFWREPEFHTWLFVLSFLLLTIGQTLRYLAILTLRERWNTRIIVLPGAPRIEKGIYRYLSHPNYIGVVLEIAAVPLLHSAWMTAFAFTVGNGYLLYHRITLEEKALVENT